MRIRLAVFALLLLPHAASAANFRVVSACNDPGCSHYLYIMGKIENGDAQRAKDAIRQAGTSLDTVDLRSIGGSMYDSIAIGTLLSDLWVNTAAPYYAGHCEREDARWGIHNAQCTCVSGCFLIWMGGVNRYGVIVGMHNPFDMSGQMGRLDYDNAAPIYKQWISDLATYLQKMELPNSYISTFVTTVRSDSMHMLTGNELLQLNHMPSKSEWLTNRCGQWNTGENDEMGRLETAKFQNQDYDTSRLASLESRYNSIQTCKSNAQLQERTEAFRKIFQ